MLLNFFTVGYNILWSCHRFTFWSNNCLTLLL